MGRRGKQTAQSKLYLDTYFQLCISLTRTVTDQALFHLEAEAFTNILWVIHTKINTDLQVFKNPFIVL